MVAATTPMYIHVPTPLGDAAAQPQAAPLPEKDPVVLSEPVLLEESWLETKLREMCPVHKSLYKKEKEEKEKEEKEERKKAEKVDSVQKEEQFDNVALPPGIFDMDSVTSTTDINSMTSMTDMLPLNGSRDVAEELAGVHDWGMQGEEDLVSSMLQALGDDFSGWGEGCSCMRGDRRWWTRSPHPLLCPITSFPINHLPYPPFKLRVDPSKPSPYKLVDGKSLAIMFIVNPSVSACGRELLTSDLHALDLYMQRCKLGPFRPARMLELQHAVKCACSTESRNAAVSAVVRYCKDARAELGRLRKIQEGRLSQIMAAQGGRPCPTGKADKKRGSRKNSDETSSRKNTDEKVWY